MPKICCLMPTYNRYPTHSWLLDEGVESFLRQTDEDSELIVCNDTPGQTLIYDHPRVDVVNVPVRFDTLSDKLQFMIDRSDADLFCRWDDDDINLAHRLEFSRKSLDRDGGALSWRSVNYWYYPTAEKRLVHVRHPGNTHTMGLWSRDLLDRMPWGGKYPQKMSGWEDQEFVKHEDQITGTVKEELNPSDIFYLYRWGSSTTHLSGFGAGPEILQNHWDKIGRRGISLGRYEIQPHWRHDYADMAAKADPTPQR